ncbi:expressed unknown protein [Ectocarpus siliculosus]|uniref:Uncharacterized protein n=1 Tax=Ectocarpus siliculosus TaxID=2880 RepID=D8LBL9_ECTSI|nr:expressed unknown protein [Ectocarpus siliculosus]|eukprot:CBN76728.1 expressed unknown protein [Ectocarpus siliculosus]
MADLMALDKQSGRLVRKTRLRGKDGTSSSSSSSRGSSSSHNQQRARNGVRLYWGEAGTRPGGLPSNAFRFCFVCVGGWYQQLARFHLLGT